MFTSSFFFYVHVTVHRNNFLVNKNNQTHEFPKFYFFIKTLHVSGISFAQQGQDGTSSILTLLGSCHRTCKKCTVVECTVDNS